MWPKRIPRERWIIDISPALQENRRKLGVVSIFAMQEKEEVECHSYR